MTDATPARPAPPHATMRRMSWNGRRGCPRPPADIETEMMAAGKTGDPIRLGIAHARFEAWLTDQGFTPDHHTGNHTPDEVWQ
jgi:hypothetical protein